MMDTPRFSFFPNPVADETVYSWLSRYHLMSGNRSFRRHTLPMLGVHHGRPANEFPGYLPALAQAAAYPLEIIASEMTPFHYYAPFMKYDLRNHFWKALITGETDAIHSQIGDVAGRLTPGRCLYSCRYCIEEDMKRHGFPIWHLSHQLLGVEVCPRHNEHLHITSRVNIQAQLPKPVAHSQSNPLEERYATLILEELSDHSAVLSGETVVAAYSRRLREHGLLTEQGRVREKLLRSLLQSHLNALPQGYAEYDFLRKQISLHRYPECLFYLTNASHHPLKHLVLIEALFEDWNDFKEEALSSQAPELVEANPPSTVPQKLSLSEEAAQKLRNGHSLRTVSVAEGVSVTTLGILADQRCIETDKRPSKIFPDIERAIWRKLVLGDKTTDIAPQFNLSVGAVEIILRKHPELVALRKRIWFYQSREHHRSILLAYQRENPKSGRQQIREAKGATYAWLYKHDNAWLYAHLPEAVPRAQRPKRTRCKDRGRA